MISLAKSTGRSIHGNDQTPSGEIRGQQSFSIVKELAKKFTKWLATRETVSWPWRILSTVVIYGIESKGGVVAVCYDDPERKKVIDLIRQIKRENPLLVFDNEAYQIFMAVKRTQRIQGDLAEVGVYRGGTAKLIREADGNRALHLFDTFEGLPEVEHIDRPLFSRGQFAASIDGVKSYLKDYQNIFLLQGIISTHERACCK